MLFGPLWVTIQPACIMIVIALFCRLRAIPVLLIAGLISLIPISGYCIPWQTWFQSPGRGLKLNIVTCNVNGGAFDDARLVALLAEFKPDVVVLQEWNPKRKSFPFDETNWSVEISGELLIASRFPLVKQQDFSKPAWVEFGGSIRRYDLVTPNGPLSIFNVHLASPHRPFDAIIDGRPAAMAMMQNHLSARAEQCEQISSALAEAGPGAVAAGDFNTIAEGSLYQTYWSRFADAFATAGSGFGATYRFDAANVRIDHVLMGSSWQCTECRVGPDIGSPHRPVMARLERIQDPPETMPSTAP